MPNITLSMDEKLAEAGRRYAREHHTSLNALIRKLLESTISQPSEDRLEELFRLADKAHFSSKGKSWKREDLYDV
jgi:hypothetical protein